MKLLRAAYELEPGDRKVCLGIGFFDGVHLGHQQIIRQTISDARRHESLAVILTFDRHPNSIVAPDRTPPLIYSFPQKLRVIESFGVDALLVIPFDKAFSLKTGESFVRELARDLGQIHSLCVGANFVFGHLRGGDVELLKKLGAELKFSVHGLASVALDGQPVSSTRIRRAIRSGDLDAASQMLGRTYSLAGEVLHGDSLGRQLGFPTANVQVAGLALPPHGVYAAHATTAAGTWRAVVNIGIRPTLASPTPELRVEAHLLDFQGDLYGQQLELAFVEMLRAEKKFASLSDLRDQIPRDIQEAQTRF